MGLIAKAIQRDLINNGYTQCGKAATKSTFPNSPPSQEGDKGVVKIFTQKGGF